MGQKAKNDTMLVICPGHNVIVSDPSDNHETNHSVLPLTQEQRNELTKWAQSRKLPAGDVLRARLILALGDGASYRNEYMSNWRHRRRVFISMPDDRR